MPLFDRSALNPGVPPREAFAWALYDFANSGYTTVVLTAVSCGTDLSITQEGIPSVIPAEACYLGWQESLVLLAKLVEAEVPEA